MSRGYEALQKKTVVIVEDNLVQRQLVKESLDATALYNVVEFDNGKIALDYFSNHHESVDLVILDYILPGLNGIDILRSLRSKTHYSFPVLMLTTQAESKGSEIKDLNVISWIIKPIQAERWPDMVKKALELYPRAK